MGKDDDNPTDEFLKNLRIQMASQINVNRQSLAAASAAERTLSMSKDGPDMNNSLDSPTTKEIPANAFINSLNYNIS